MVDYTNEGFILPIEKDGVQGYASVNAMLAAEEDGLDNTGNYFVYLLHPTIGSTHFILEPTTSNAMPWKRQGGDIRVEKEIVQEIIDSIELRKNKTAQD